MKKRTILILTFAALLIVAPACGGNADTAPAAVEDIPAEEEPAEEKASEQQQSSNSGPCANFLFPLAEGNTWVYEADSIDENGNPTVIEYTWTVSGAQGNTVTLDTSFPESGTNISADITCSDGAIQNFPLTVSNISFGDVQGAIQYTYVSGQYLPSAAQLESGDWDDTWQTVITSSGTITTGYEGQSMTITMEESPMTMNWEILERDVSVTVPAGSFDNAIRIRQELIYELNSLSIDTIDLPMDISTTMIYETDYWFVPEVGMVKTEIQSGNIDLLGSNFPIDMTSTTQLVSSSLLD